MATGVENILGYKGDTSQGIGANTRGFLVDPSQQLSAIQKVGNDIMLLDAQRGVQMFNQKIKDRDDRYKLLAEGKISAGEMDPKYRPFFDEAEKKVTKAFLGIKGANDDVGREKYLQAVRELKDVTAHAQSKTLEKQSLEVELSKQTSPTMIKNYENHIKGQDDKPFWDMYDPYHPMPQFNLGFIKKALNDSIIGSASALPGSTTNKTTVTNKDGQLSTTQTQTTAAAKKGTQPIVDATTKVATDEMGRTVTTTEQKVDFGKVLNNAAQVYISEPDERFNMEQYMGKVESDPSAGKQVLDHMKQRIADYNSQYGFDESNPNDIKLKIGNTPDSDIVEVRNQQGQLQGYKVNMPIPKFAAMVALAEHEGPYVQKSSQWDKDYDEYRLDNRKEDEVIRHNKAMEAQNKDKNWLAWSKFNFQKDQLDQNDKIAAVKYNGLLDKIENNRIDVNGLPASLQFIGGIVNDKDGKATIGQVYPKFHVYDPVKGGANKKGGETQELSYSKYLTLYTDPKNKTFKPAETYPEYVNRSAAEKGFKVESFYEPKYVNQSGRTIKSINDVPDDIKKLYNDFLKQGYKLSQDDFFKMMAKKGKIGAEFQGSNGIGNAASIIEGERFNQAKFGKKINLYADGGDAPVDDNQE